MNQKNILACSWGLFDIYETSVAGVDVEVHLWKPGGDGEFVSLRAGELER